MTAQEHDTINLNSQKHNIVGINGTELFDPKSVGLKPKGRVTSCWRGFVCHYVLINDLLTLDGLQVMNGYGEGPKFSPQLGTVVNEITPIYTEDRGARFNNIYEGLDLKIEFTGGILIANGFIDKLYVHMGIHPAWKFLTVHELTFDVGKVINIQNVSQKMHEIREVMIKKPLEPGLEASVRDQMRWINSTFSLTYSYNDGEYNLNIGEEPEEDLPSTLPEMLERLGRLSDESEEDS